MLSTIFANKFLPPTKSATRLPEIISGSVYSDPLRFGLSAVVVAVYEALAISKKAGGQIRSVALRLIVSTTDHVVSVSPFDPGRVARGGHAVASSRLCCRMLGHLSSGLFGRCLYGLFIPNLFHYRQDVFIGMGDARSHSHPHQKNSRTRQDGRSHSRGPLVAKPQATHGISLQTILIDNQYSPQSVARVDSSAAPSLSVSGHKECQGCFLLGYTCRGVYI